MLHFVLRRLAQLPLLFLAATLLVFALMQALDPYQQVAAFVRGPQELKSFSLDQLVKKYNLDAPIHVKYATWMGQLLRGNLGWSEAAKEPVLDALIHRFPATVELTLYASVPMALGGIWLGVLSAVQHNRPLDHISRVFAIVGWSFPAFVLGLLFLMIFYGVLGWFPPDRLSVWATQVVISPEFRQYTGLVTVDALLNRRPEVFFDALRHLVGPVVTLSYLYLAQLVRITRSSMLETLQQDYIRTARAKGLDERAVIRKHALRNALIPVVTVVSFMLFGLLAGVAVTETVFGYPGVGRLMVQGAVLLDRATVLGVLLLYVVILAVLYLLLDILYAAIDPRVRAG